MFLNIKKLLNLLWLIPKAVAGFVFVISKPKTDNRTLYTVNYTL